MNLSLLNKKVLGLIVLAAFLPVVFASIGVANSQAKAAQTLRLANGKSISLGQTMVSVKESLKNNISEVRPGIYRYPADKKYPAQVNIYTDKGNVAAMLVGRNKKHFQVQNKLHLGVTGTKLSRVFGGRLQTINTKIDIIKHRGYRVGGLGVVTYYLTQTCAPGLGDNIRNGDNVIYLAMVKPGAEKIVRFLHQPLKCVPPTPKPT